MKSNTLITFSQHGSFSSTEGFLKRIKDFKIDSMLRECGQKGVAALEASTPKRTGKTAASWGYEIERTKSSIAIYWTNDNINKGRNIAVLIRRGHGTKNGGYVKGVDYITPAIQPIFEDIKNKIIKETS